MSTSYNLDVASDCIINIVDGIRCTICDRIDEGRSRYACGHTACSECVVTAQTCLLCITPPVTDDIFVDEPLTRRAKHVAELLSAFQNTFHLDVLRRRRLSEQLKLEKELFPQCIQAPQTYYNKRRSSKSIKGNHSHCSQPGEIIEPSKMESSRNFVLDWLENNEIGLTKFQPRQALSDLKINSPRLIKSPIKKRADLILDKVRGSEIQSRKKSRKRSFKTALRTTKSQSQLDKYLKTTGTGRNAKEVSREFEHHEKNTSHRKKYKDDSGIVTNDEPIVIEDSQSQVVDKDRQAWLAVIKACENEGDRLSQETITTLNKCPVICESISLKQSDKRESINQEYETRSVPKNRVHIPFYKKSSLLTPHDVSHKKDTSGSEAVEYNAREVSITVETNTLVTTIQVSRCQKPKIVNKSSKSVQTDVAEDLGNNTEGKKQNNKRDMATEMHGMECETNKLNELYSTDVFNSQDLFTGAADKNAAENIAPAENKNYLINESGSDSEHEHSSLLVVTADVHQSRESELQRRILAEIHEAESAMKRPTKRGHSPESSNSSNKENQNPNARKKQNDKNRKKRKD